jgi:hypothetical protein
MLWHADPLLGSDPLTTEEWCILRGPLSNNWTATEERCCLYGPCWCYIMGSSCYYERVLRRQMGDSHRPVRTWTRNLWKLRHWKPLPSDNRWIYSRLRRLRTCCSELAIALELLVVTSSVYIIPIANPSPVYSHTTSTWQYISPRLSLNYMVLQHRWPCSSNIYLIKSNLCSRCPVICVRLQQLECALKM